MKTFTRPEKKAAQILQDDMPLTEKPFAAIADACGLTGDDLLAWIQELSQKGIPTLTANAVFLKKTSIISMKVSVSFRKCSEQNSLLI